MAGSLATGLAVRHFGSRHPDRPSVVVLPGFGVSRYLRPGCEQLAQRSGLPVMLIDPPGFGMNTGQRPASFEVAAIVEVLGRFLADLGPVLLVGQSTGCLLAARLARAHSQLSVEGLALVGPVFDPAAATVGRAAFRLLRDAVHEPWWLGPVEAPEWMINMRALPGYLRSCLAERLADTLDAVQCPVAIVRGDNDPISGHGWAVQLADAPARTLVTVPGGAHTFMAARPQTLADALRVAGFGTPWPVS